MFRKTGLTRLFADRSWTRFLALGVVTLTLWGFLVLTGEVLENEYHGIDNRILLAFRTPEDLRIPIGPSWVQSVSLDISALGSAAVLTLLTLLICGYFLLEKRLDAVLMILCASVSGSLLNWFLKSLIGRERPNVVPYLSEIHNTSYPSGHSMLSAIIYLTLAVVLGKMVKTRAKRLYILSTAIGLAFFIGLTRVILGVHFLSDVVAGWTVGIGWATLCWMFSNYVSGSFKDRTTQT